MIYFVVKMGKCIQLDKFFGILQGYEKWMKKCEIYDYAKMNIRHTLNYYFHLVVF